MSALGGGIVLGTAKQAQCEAASTTVNFEEFKQASEEKQIDIIKSVMSKEQWFYDDDDFIRLVYQNGEDSIKKVIEDSLNLINYEKYLEQSTLIEVFFGLNDQKKIELIEGIRSK